VRCTPPETGYVVERENLINNNIGIVKVLADEVQSRFGNRLGTDFDDLVQEGLIALWKCIDRYEERPGVSFISYAKKAVKNAMIDLIRKSKKSQQECVSIDENITEQEQLLMSAITDSTYYRSPEQIIIKAEAIRELYQALNSLKERERTYLLYRFGFEDGNEHSLIDTVSRFFLSTSRAKSLETTALEKMRKLLRR